jgi:hypothetical protein
MGGTVIDVLLDFNIKQTHFGQYSHGLYQLLDLLQKEKVFL